MPEIVSPTPANIKNAITTAYYKEPLIARDIVIDDTTKIWLTNRPTLAVEGMDIIVNAEVTTELTQAFQIAFTQKGNAKYLPIKSRMRKFKIDDVLVPEIFEDTILHEWADDAKDAKNMDFAKFWFSHLANLLQEEELLDYMFFGVYQAPTAGVAGDANKSIDGFNKIMIDADALPPSEQPFKFVTMGDWNIETETYLYINEFLKACYGFRPKMRQNQTGSIKQLLLPPKIYDAYVEQRGEKKLTIDTNNPNLAQVFWEKDVQFVSEIALAGRNDTGKRIILQRQGTLARYYNTMNADRSFISFGSSENPDYLPYRIKFQRAYTMLNPFTIIANDVDGQTP